MKENNNNSKCDKNTVINESAFIFIIDLLISFTDSEISIDIKLISSLILINFRINPKSSLKFWKLWRIEYTLFGIWVWRSRNRSKFLKYSEILNKLWTENFGINTPRADDNPTMTTVVVTVAPPKVSAGTNKIISSSYSWVWELRVVPSWQSSHPPLTSQTIQKLVQLRIFNINRYSYVFNVIVAWRVKLRFTPPSGAIPETVPSAWSKLSQLTWEPFENNRNKSKVPVFPSIQNIDSIKIFL